MVGYTSSLQKTSPSAVSGRRLAILITLSRAALTAAGTASPVCISTSPTPTMWVCLVMPTPPKSRTLGCWRWMSPAANTWAGWWAMPTAAAASQAATPQAVSQAKTTWAVWWVIPAAASKTATPQATSPAMKEWAVWWVMPTVAISRTATPPAELPATKKWAVWWVM